MGKVRLEDIAKKIGVSGVTVHNALYGNKGVSDEMRAKIKSVAEEMGYQINSGSKKNAKENTEFRTIGVLIAENYLAQYTTFYWKMYQELAVLATERRCFTSVEVLMKVDEKRTLKLPACVAENKVEGLIVLGEIDKNYIINLKKMTEIPIIFLDFYDKDLANDAVVANNFHGMFLMTEFMFEQGIEELAFVGSVHETSSIMDRYCGFMKSMMKHGKGIRPEWIIEDRDKLGQMGFELPKALPQGFVCSSDLAAVMVIEKLKERGYRVPEDISVVGFDNYLPQGLLDTKVTTYEVNTKTMVRVAIDKMLKRLKKSRSGYGFDVISGHMVVKNSVKLK